MDDFNVVFNFLKDSLLEVEEKYRKAMVSNAQLDNEKTNMMYEVDTLKDSLMELEEMLFETRRELEEKIKVCTVSVPYKLVCYNVLVNKKLIAI